MAIRNIFILAFAVALAGTAYAIWPMPHSNAPGEDPMLANLYQKPREQFAAGGQFAAATGFDAERCMKYLKTLVDIGPRVSGTDGMIKQQEFLVKHFENLGAKVEKQTFEAKQLSLKGKKTPMTNLIIRWYPDRAKRVLLCCHYDTRPHADEERDPIAWNKPFPSANDGTAGVALFMELAHQMKEFPTKVGVDFILFDGEEFVFNAKDGGDDLYFFGSEHFAKDYKQTKGKRTFEYQAGVLLDLCGAEGSKLKVEANSFNYAPDLVKKLWGIAQEVKAKSFLYERGFARDQGQGVLDDHLALNAVGIPTVDIIDFDYKHWHKITDTVDKVSATQQTEVATVLITWLKGL